MVHAMRHAACNVCAELLSIYSFNKIIKTNVDVTYIIHLKFLVFGLAVNIYKI